MNIQLIVVQAFGPHEKGVRVTEPKEIATILAGEHAAKVIRVAATSKE